MAIYDSTVKNLGTNIKEGLSGIAKAIDKVAAKPSYTINVIVMPGATSEEVDAKVQETLERVQAREAAVGAD